MSSVIENDNDNDVKYQNGKIYKIVCNITGNIYIGSTIRTLNERLSKHKNAYKIYKKGKINYSVTSFEIIKNDDFYIELIENYSCNSRYELELRERYHIEHNICVNKQIPTKTIEEWRRDNKEKTKKYHKQRYNKHKEKLDEINKKYRLEHKAELGEKAKVKILCEICNCNITKSNIARHKKSQLHINNLNNIIKLKSFLNN